MTALRESLQAGSEPNPWPTTVPVPVEELMAYLQEQAQTLREQHSLNTAGDTTFSWVLLTQIDTAPRYRVGSLGRFFHPNGSVIRARYCRLGFMEATEWLGAPVGLELGEGVAPWTVTNSLNKSHLDLVIGLGAWYSSPQSNSYGWVIVEGFSIHGVLCLNNTSIALGSPLVWTDGLGVMSGTVGAGRTLGKVARLPLPAEGDHWQLSPGTIFVELGSDSKTQITSWITQTIAPLTSQVNALQDLVEQELGDSRIANLETALDADVAARLELAALLTQSNGTFSQNVNALAKRVSTLESKELGVSTADLNQVSSDFSSTVGNLSVAVASHTAQLTSIDSRLTDAQEIVSGVPDSLGALQLAINTLEERITAEAGFPVGTDGRWLQLAAGLPTWAAIDKSTVGLGNVDNTSDATKPIGTATQTALNLKATSASVSALAIGPAGIHNPTGNVDFTATWGTTPRTIRLRGTLTADRTLTLSTTGAVDGARFRIYRIATGAFNWNIGGLKTLATSTWCDVEFGLGVWILVGYGTL